MPNLKEIKGRIASVKSTQKITRAMKMVAAAKLRRAQDAIVKARPYAHHMMSLVSDLALRAEAGAHPLLRKEGGNKVVLIVLSSDRGLCGGFNTNIINESMRQLRTDFADKDTKLVVVGRRGIDLLRRRQTPILTTHTGMTEKSGLQAAGEIIDPLVENFVKGDTDEIYVLYNEFRSAISQRVTLERLLPFEPADDKGEVVIDYLYEPSFSAVMEQLLVRHLHIQMHRMLYESAASEHGARMTAMDSATNNAGEMIERLTLHYNRARQAAITKELIEVIGGAEAL